ncbi:MAG: hypothetical protein AAFY60_06265, partial [Myxococcota bacterium]
RVRGDFDPANPNGSPNRGFDAIRVGTSNHTTIHQCHLSGIASAIDPTDAQNLVVNDSKIENWSGYGMLMGDGGWVSFNGVSLVQDPFAVNGSGPPSAEDGPVRISRPNGPVSFHQVDIFTNNGSVGTSGVKANIEWLTGTVPAPQSLVIERARTEGGRILGGADGSSALMRVLLDKVHHVSTYSPSSLLQLRNPGTTARNIVIVAPDVEPLSTTGTRNLVSFSVETPSAAEGLYPKEIYSCTLIDLRSPENAENSSGAPRAFEPFSGGAGENCVVFAPRLAEGTEEDAPLDATSRWTPRNPGRSIEGLPFDPAFATPAEAAALYSPLTLSPAIGSADTSSNTAVDDFFGVRRPDRPSRGATEP